MSLLIHLPLLNPLQIGAKTAIDWHLLLK